MVLCHTRMKCEVTCRKDQCQVHCFLGHPERQFPIGLMFYCRCFFFLSPRDLRASSADRRKTLPHDRQLGEFYNASPKIRGALPPKKLGAKNMQNSARFHTTSDFDREYLRNGTRYPKSENVLIESDSSRVQRKKSGELWSTNYRELDVSLDLPKLNFSGEYISALRGCWPLKF